jgi:hypothetical protein
LPLQALNVQMRGDFACKIRDKCSHCRSSLGRARWAV